MSNDEEKYVDPLLVMFMTVGIPCVAIIFFILLFTFPVAILGLLGLLWLISKAK